jgi:hypothetical protein
LNVYIFSRHGHGRVGIVGGCLLGRLCVRVADGVVIVVVVVLLLLLLLSLLHMLSVLDRIVPSGSTSSLTSFVFVPKGNV